MSVESAAFGMLHPVIQHHVVNTLQWPALHPLQAGAVQPVLDGVDCLFLALDLDQVLRATGLLLRWSQGWVEPVTPPPSPRYIVAQQLLALALAENTLGRKTWPEWWHGLAPMTADGDEVLRYLIDEGYLETDGDLAFIGPEAERRFGRRRFSDLMAVFTSAPEFVVLAGRDEIESVGDDVLLADTRGAARVLLLAGQAWLVTHVDWNGGCFVRHRPSTAVQ